MNAMTTADVQFRDRADKPAADPASREQNKAKEILSGLNVAANIRQVGGLAILISAFMLASACMGGDVFHFILAESTFVSGLVLLGFSVLIRSVLRIESHLRIDRSL